MLRSPVSVPDRESGTSESAHPHPCPSSSVTLGEHLTKGDPEEEVLKERIGGPGILLERHESDKAERSASPLCPPARQPVQGRAFKGKVLATLRGKGPREGPVASRMTRHGPSSSASPVGSSLDLPGRHHPNFLTPGGGGPSGLRMPTPHLSMLRPACSLRGKSPQHQKFLGRAFPNPSSSIRVTGFKRN